MRRGQSLVTGDSPKRARDRKVPHEFDQPAAMSRCNNARKTRATKLKH
jgi:hypothetical protein